MDVAINPADPQLTLDMALTYTWTTPTSGEQLSNHPDPTQLQVQALVYLEGFYT